MAQNSRSTPVSIDLLSAYALELAARIGEKSGERELAPHEITSFILQDSAFLDWHESKVKFSQLHSAPDRRFTGRSTGRIVATEKTAWDDSSFGYYPIEQGQINWVRLGTTNHGIKEIEEGFNRHKLNSPGIKEWLITTDASRNAGRRAQSEKIREQGRTYTRWTHDAPFVAQIEYGPAQACATIRSQLRVPAFNCADPMDAVLRAEVELLSLTQHGDLISMPKLHYRRDEKPAAPTSYQQLQRLLEMSIPMLLVGAARDLLETIYSESIEATDSDNVRGDPLIPTVSLTIHIPERFAGQEKVVAKAILKALKNPNGEYFHRDDELPRLASITVSVLSAHEQAQRLGERDAAQLQAKERQMQAAAEKAIVQPGDEFALIKVELPGFRIATDGRLYPARFYKMLGDLENEVSMSPQEVLQAAQADLPWLDTTSDWRAVSAWISNGAELFCDHVGWDVDEETMEIAKDCVKTALRLRGLPQQTRVSPPTIWLILDSATLFPYAEQGPHHADLAEIMQRATDPSNPQSMGAIPKRVKVASAIQQAHPELQDWALSCGIELVGPKSGFDAGSMHVKFWRKLAESVLEWGLDPDADKNAWWCGANSMTQEELAKAIRYRIKRHQDVRTNTMGQSDVEQIRWYLLDDGIASVKAQKYVDWRRAQRQKS